MSAFQPYEPPTLLGTALRCLAAVIFVAAIVGLAINVGYLLALSSTFLTQADSVVPALAAALPYAASRSSDTRIVSQRLSPLATGGLPSGFFMAGLCTNK
jgi:hypothetical protein